MDIAARTDETSGVSVEMAGVWPDRVQVRAGDPWSFPEFGEKVTGDQQVSLERLKIETMRRRGLEKLFGMIRYHTSRQVKSYKGEEMDDFVRDISAAIHFLAQYGIHFSPPQESAGKDGWVRFVRALEDISSQVYAGTYAFEHDDHLSPGALYAQEPYRQPWTLDGMMAQCAPGFDLQHAAYTTYWQSFCNVFRGADQRLTEDQPGAYVRALHKHVVPELAPALARIFSMHSERIVCGMKDVRRRVDGVVGEKGGSANGVLETLRAQKFQGLIGRVGRLHDGYDRIHPKVQAVSQIVQRAKEILDLEFEIPDKYRLRTDVIANELRQMYSIGRMMTRE